MFLCVLLPNSRARSTLTPGLLYSSVWLWVRGSDTCSALYALTPRLPETLPFLLRERLSYSKIATFTLCSYPYSLKLLWSPIVDARFFSSIGRRRSWIIPTQTILGSIMLWMSFNVQAFLDNVRRLESSMCSDVAAYR